MRIREQKRFQIIFRVFPIFLATLVLSCNKDDIIENPVPDNPPSDIYGGRPTTSTSSPYINKVYDYIPAPGQYINDFGGDINSENISEAEAAEWAFNRMRKKFYVSLGAFGGYLVAGFDHSIYNTGDYEFGVFGNAFMSANGSSNEPGVVYVMKDENGNGYPDDTWYELKGIDTFAEGTIRDYVVTYLKPEKEGQPIVWKDNLGNTGLIDYLGAFHSQPSYYPIWIDADQYTLLGTCLEAKTIQNPETGNWENPPFEWGYADNMGEDNLAYDGCNNCNRFRISDAIDDNGNPVVLDFIDFVKVQTGVSSSSGWLGEVSTEILGIIDLNIPL